MKIWKLKFEVDFYDNLEATTDMDIDEILSFDGQSKLLSWQPIKVKRMEPEKEMPLGDTPGFIAPVLSKKAQEVLFTLFNNSVELLPLDFEEGEYSIANAINVVDCIDYKNSEYRTFSDGKRIMAFKKYAFIAEKVDKLNFFKIIDEPKRNVFVSEAFVQAVNEANLKGFRFELVWDSEI